MRGTLKFNPSFQSDEEAVDAFIVRTVEFQHVVDGLLSAARTPARAPRYLVTAPRGAGKTTLCRRVAAEVRLNVDLQAFWFPLILGEESYGIGSPGEFFLECLFQLNDQAPSPAVAEAYAEATRAESEEVLLSRSLEALGRFAADSGKRILLVVENLHMILRDQMRSSDADNLLRLLSDGKLFAVLATSVAQTSSNSEFALDDFIVMALPPLTLDDCHLLWSSLTGGDVERDRVKPIYFLTGGNPRLVHILAEFMTTPSLRELMDNLNHLIDQNTEYFKSQLDSLPSTERKAFAALLDLWDPSTAKQVSEIARLSINNASAMLARLAERGVATKAPGQGRTALYHASERLFNIYYLMRRRTHPSARVRALVTFMVEYYDRDELIDTTALLMSEACRLEPARRGDYHYTFDAIMDRSEPSVRALLLEKVPDDFIQSFRAAQREARSAAALLPKAADKHQANEALERLAKQIEQAVDDDNDELAYHLVLEGIETIPDAEELWLRKSFLEHGQGQYSDAMRSAERAIQLDPGDTWAHVALALSHEALDDEGAAEQSFLRALALDPSQSVALSAVGAYRADRGDLLGAISLLDAIDDPASISDANRAFFGQLLAEDGQVGRAEALLRPQVNEAGHSRSRRALVELLETTDRQEEGIEVLRRATEDIGSWQAWADLGTYLAARTEHLEEGKAALRRAIDADAGEPGLYYRLAQAVAAAGDSSDDVAAIALELVGKRPANAQSWVAAGRIYELIGDDSEAETAYRTALDQEDGEIASLSLGRLLAGRQGRRNEAEDLLRKSIASAPGPAKCVPSRELAELLIHHGDEAGASEVLALGVAANPHCSCCMALEGDICRRRADIAAAEAHYRESLKHNPNSIPALTGLAQVASGKEAAELIALASKARPGDPRVLLARALSQHADFQKQVEDAQAALEGSPRFTDARVLLAQLMARRRDLGTAIGHLSSALDELPERRELIPAFVSAGMATAQIDGGAALGALLDNHPNTQTVEPLAVAIKIMRGESPVVAREIAQVAEDIVQSWKGAAAR